MCECVYVLRFQARVADRHDGGPCPTHNGDTVPRLSGWVCRGSYALEVSTDESAVSSYVHAAGRR